MKKAISLLLALVMCLSLCACGTGSSDATTAPTTEPTTTPTTAPATTPTTTPTEPTIPVVQLSLGQKASTALIDFKLINCAFTYYAVNWHDGNPNSTYMMPTAEPNSYYAASMGRCLVSMGFVIKIKNRTSMNVAGSIYSDWDINWTVNYKDEEYPVRSWGLNSGNDGADPFKAEGFSFFTNDWRYLDHCGTSNCILDAGETYYMRAIGIVKMDPTSLKDGFELTINLPNADGGYDYFTFVIPSK